MEARCQVENEDVVGAAPTGDAPTTSGVINNFIAYGGASYIRGLTIGTKFGEIGIKLFFFIKNMHFKISSAKCRPFCSTFNVFKRCHVRLISRSRPLNPEANRSYHISWGHRFLILVHQIWAFVMLNQLAPGRHGCNLQCAIFKPIVSLPIDLFHNKFPPSGEQPEHRNY